jgi:hypothetical protein
MPGDGTLQKTPKSANGRFLRISLGHWAVVSALAPELGRPGPMRRRHGPRLDRVLSLEQPWGELAEIVSPVNPGVTASASVKLVLDTVLVEHFPEALRASQCEVLVTDAD